nr:putative reverse transcriptase domain-containing protein [Tanacetum cinerariifolium]
CLCQLFRIEIDGLHHVPGKHSESLGDSIGYDYGLSSSDGWTKSPILWAEIRKSRLIGPKLVQEMTDKVVLIKEKLKAVRDRQKSVHDTFHVSNLKKCLTDANLHVPLDEINIDKTLHFVEEPVEILDRYVKGLKRSKILNVKVHKNLKCGPEFMWEREDHMKANYPRLFVDCAVEPSS